MAEQGIGCVGRFLLAAGIVLALGLCAWVFLPWPFALGATVLLVLGAKFALPYFILRSVSNLLEEKSRDLAGARVTIHGVEPIPQPEEVLSKSGEDLSEEQKAYRKAFGEEVRRRKWFHVDLTIAPNDGPDEITGWDLNYFGFVHPKHPPHMPIFTKELYLMIVLLDGDAEVYDGHGFVVPESVEVEGAQRIRFRAGTRPGVDKAVLAYGLERLAEISFPLE